jgi:hypothetical protein
MTKPSRTLPLAQIAGTLPLAQIEASHFTIEQVAEIAEIPMDRLLEYCIRETWLQGEEFERFQSTIAIGRIHWAEEQAKQAGAPFDRDKAEQESFALAMAEMEQDVAEFAARIAAMKAKAFTDWVRAEEQRQGIKITNLEAAASIFESVQKAELA